MSPSSIPRGARSAILTVSGTSAAGSGCFDPGAGFPERLTASVSGGVIVRWVTCVNRTTLVLDVTTGATRTTEARTITITHADGQSTTSAAIPNVVPSLNLGQVPGPASHETRPGAPAQAHPGRFRPSLGRWDHDLRLTC